MSALLNLSPPVIVLPQFRVPVMGKLWCLFSVLWTAVIDRKF